MKNSRRNKANAEAKAKKVKSSKYAAKGKPYEYESQRLQRSYVEQFRRGR